MSDRNRSDTTISGSDGEDTDGGGTLGIVEEKKREAMMDDDETMDEGADGSGSIGTTTSPPGLASGLQSGGTVPGGGPGNSEGSIGTGGGSNADRDTGTLKHWDQGQHQESDR